MEPLHQQLLDAGAKPKDVEKLKALGWGQGQIIAWIAKNLPTLIGLFGSLKGGAPAPAASTKKK